MLRLELGHGRADRFGACLAATHMTAATEGAYTKQDRRGFLARQIAAIMTVLLVCEPAAAENPKAAVAVVVLPAADANPKLTRTLRTQMVPTMPSLAKTVLLTGKPLAKAIGGNPATAFGKCGSDLHCIAAVGARAKAVKVILVRVEAASAGVSVDLELVDVATAGIVNKDTFSLEKTADAKAALDTHLATLMSEKGGVESAPATADNAASKAEPADQTETPTPEASAAPSPTTAATGSSPSSPSSPAPPSPAPATNLGAPSPEPAMDSISAAPVSARPSESAPAPAVAAQPAETAVEAETAPTAGRLGTRGIERVESAWTTKPQDVVISLGGDGYSGKRLFASNDTDTLFHQQLFLTWAPVKGLDLTVGEAYSTNDNSVWKPAAVVHTFGNPTLGAKYGVTLTPDFAIAAAVRAFFPTALQGRSLVFNATSVAGLLSASYRVASFVGLSLNLGYLLDRSAQLSRSALTPVQRFALGISDSNQATAGLGVETDWSLGGNVRAGPFAEVTSGFGIDTKLREDPIRATVGTKIDLFSGNILELSVGADFALEGKASTADSNMAGIAPWDVFVRIAGHLGPLFARQPAAISCTQASECGAGMTCHAGTCAVVTEIVRVEQVVRAQATYRISGKVTNRNTHAPLDSANVAISGYETSPLVVNRNSGEYVSFPLPCGEGLVQLTAIAEGFHQEQKTVQKGSDQQIMTVDFALQPASELIPAELRGSIKDAENGHPIQGSVFIPVLNLKINADEKGYFRTTVSPGRYELLITAPQYLTQKKEIHLRGGDSVILNVDMSPRGK